MPKPITIQFFLPDGEPHGVRMAEVTTRTVQAICVPRNRLSGAHRRAELSGVGIYFLGFRSMETPVDHFLWIIVPLHRASEIVEGMTPLA